MIIGEYSPRRSRGEYSPIITEPEAKINRRATRIGTFEVKVAVHVALCMFTMQVLAGQLPFLANRNAELAVPQFFWPVNCIEIGGHVELLSAPAVYCQNCAIDHLQSTPSWLTFETHSNHKVSIHYF